ncbi:MAG: winged helix-turn-helix transcriptional regulator [Candidatus Micrarchaeia archaeon]
MTKSRAVADYIEKELPYQLLMRLNDNSRLSLRKLGRELNISYHVIAAKLKELEEKYKLFYTLDIDTDKLGFAEGRLITIKFEKMPDIDFIKGLFAKDIFVQDAYLAQGDFDLVMYVVGLSQKDFQNWQFNLRIKLKEYNPTLKVSNLNYLSIGFFPINNELLKQNKILSNSEKRVLMLLNDNSRMKLSNIVEKTHLSQMKVLYIIKKLRKIGIINRFTTIVQNPDKRIYSAFGTYIYPSPNWFDLTLKFEEELLREDLHTYSNDYSLIATVNGSYDLFCICTFKSGELLTERGSPLIQKLWSDEKPKIENALLIDLLKGLWPFSLNRYKNAEKDVSSMRARSLE